jgi:hypothetical protein
MQQFVANALEKYHLSCAQLRLCSIFKSTFNEIKDRQRAFKVKGGFKDLKTHFNEYETQFLVKGGFKFKTAFNSIL